MERQNGKLKGTTGSHYGQLYCEYSNSKRNDSHIFEIDLLVLLKCYQFCSDSLSVVSSSLFDTEADVEVEDK